MLNAGWRGTEFAPDALPWAEPARPVEQTRGVSGKTVSSVAIEKQVLRIGAARCRCHAC